MAVYGLLGLHVSIVYDLNLAPSVTSMGRSMISAAILCFEMFLGNNVKFSSLNDILIFIDNVRSDIKECKYNDFEILGVNGFADINETFNKLIMNCGYKYIPSMEDMDIVYKILQSCNQIELNRLFYKNNLFGFMDLPIARDLMIKIFTNMNRPYLSPMEPPKNIIEDLDKLRDLMLEYVFYCHQIMDRMVRNKSMIKSVSLVSDTDSSFVSLDAWVRYNEEYLKNYDSPILHQKIDIFKAMDIKKWGDYDDNEDIPEWFDPSNKVEAIHKINKDEFGDPIDNGIYNAIIFEDPDYKYDFFSEEYIEQQRMINPLIMIQQDNMRFALVNIMCYILDSVINLYMIDFSKEAGSFRGKELCRLNMKNEFFMTRILLTEVKKHYATLQVLQEGNWIEGGNLQVAGIDCLTKSSTSRDTQKALKKILLEDILTTNNIDQVKILNDIAILEQDIYNNLKSGDRKFYKPVTIKSFDNYETPLRIQGIKASIVWNHIKPKEYPAINLNERNGIDVVKVKIDRLSIDKIKYINQEVYEKIHELIDKERENDNIYGGIKKDMFKGGHIDSLAIPRDITVPDWLLELIDYENIISDNISGFPVSSAGISQMDNKRPNYSNVIKL